MKSSFLAIAASFFAAPALACSPPNESQLENASTAVVWGVYSEGAGRGLGIVEPSQLEKGPSAKSYNVRWNPEAVDDGVNCPTWRPTWLRQSGKFYLSENGDGTFTVLAQADLRRVRN